MSRLGAPEYRAFTVTALFGGVGGLEYGLSTAGHHATSFCEIDPEAATVLSARFPHAALTRDIRRTDEVIAAIDPGSKLLTAGFPCTDLSQAGRVQGFAGGRSSLVRDVLELLGRRAFPHVMLENVPNWRVLHRGEYLREVVEALELLGYRWAYRTVNALAFGSPQRRLRIFLYATLEGDPRGVLFPGDVAPDLSAYPLHERAHGFYWTEGLRGLGWGEDCVPTLKGGSTVGVPSPPALLLPVSSSETGGVDHGPFRVVTPDIADAERLQGLPAGWTAAGVTTIDGGRYRDRRRWVLVGNAVNARAGAWLGERLARPQRWDGEDSPRLRPGDCWPAAAFGSARGRWAADVGTWPAAAPREPLAGFLTRAGAPLSARATRGFMSRLAQGHLRIKPGFLAALASHLATMERQENSRPTSAIRQAA